MTTSQFLVSATLTLISFGGVRVGLPAKAEAVGKVTVALDRAPLTQVCKELTRQSGVTHRTTREGERQLVALYCRDRSPAEVRNALTQLLGWTWSRSSGEGPTVYTLVKGVKLRDYEASLRTRDYRHYLDTLARLVKGAQDRDAYQPTGGPLDNQVSDWQHGGMLRSFGALPPDVQESIASGKPFVSSGDRLPRPFAGQLKDLLEAHSSQGGSAVDVRPDDQLRMEIKRDPLGRPHSLQFAQWRGGRLRLQFNSLAGGLVQFDAQRNSPQQEVPLRDRIKAAPDLLRPLPKAPPLEWPQPPAPAPSSIGWQLRDLSRRTSRPLVADCYPEAEVDKERRSPPPQPWDTPANEGLPLLNALERIRSEQDYHWRVEDPWLLLRYKEWYWEAARPKAAKR